MVPRLVRVALVFPFLTAGAVGTAHPDSLSVEQEESLQEPIPTGPERFRAGLTLTYGSPQGDFRRYVNHGFGLMLHGTMGFGLAGAFGLRLEAGGVQYGSETVEKPFSSSVGRVTVDVTTNNTFVVVGAGPYVMVPAGRIRPYAYGTVGFAYFETRSSVTSQNDTVPIAESKNFGDGTHALAGGLGVTVLVSRAKNPVSVDLGVQYRRQGKTRYLREGSIQEDGSGNISFTPIESRTDLLLFWLGVSVGLR